MHALSFVSLSLHVRVQGNLHVVHETGEKHWWEVSEAVEMRSEAPSEWMAFSTEGGTGCGEPDRDLLIYQDSWRSESHFQGQNDWAGEVVQLGPVTIISCVCLPQPLGAHTHGEHYFGHLERYFC